MEVANNQNQNQNQNQNRKRTRDDDDDNPAADIFMVEAKKQELYNVEQRRYEFYDGNGVFDFPWLKEGVVFSAEEDDHDHDHEQDIKQFGLCSYLDQDDDNVNLNIEESQNNDSNNYDLDDRSLMVQDDLDCIWSCVIDHPLDVDLALPLPLPFNKGSLHV